jgi:opacity protein-like surface antigen
MKTLNMLCGALLIASSPLALGAQGAYVGINLGAAIPNDSDVKESVFGYDVPYTVEADTGLAVGVAVGYVFHENFRVEGELAYQGNDLNKINLLGVDLPADGDISSLGLLVNGYYEIVDRSGFLFNVGAGLGFMDVEVSDLTLLGLDLPSSSDSDTVFAYQVGIGVGYTVNAKLALDLKYRYMATADPTFGTAKAEYATNNIYVGIRFGF